tara:strand:- start:2405 stop:3427 length:1023 start_codon:yes stop_codon:yes gene_type:complete
MRILITGVAGFIGYHLAKDLLQKSWNVIGLDNLNSYYEKQLKLDRLKDLDSISKQNFSEWEFKKLDLIDENLLEEIFKKKKPEIVINLAAQAGVRYSLENPKAYISSNIVGFSNILECCRKYPVKNFIYASSSSVYGGNKKLPFSESSNVDHPVSLYAATKKSNELIAHSYSHLYGISCTGLRLFTVYGPWGRPDMAPMIFTKAIFDDKPLKIFNHGLMKRDFTYINDVIQCITKLIDKPAKENNKYNMQNPDPAKSWCPHQVFNLGNNSTVKLMNFISILEREIGKKAIKEFLPMQQGDVEETFANTEKIFEYIGFKPTTSIEKGIKEFITWYKKYYRI